MANRNPDGTFASVLQITKEELKYLHWDRWMNITEIADFKNVSETVILKRFNDFNIKKRNGNEIDIRNKKFGKLTALKYLCGKNRNAIWLFKCDCGNKVQNSSHTVTSGHAKSCGRCDEKELVGKCFGKLMVIKTYYKKIKAVGKLVNRLFCKCKCECGKASNVSAGHLKSGHTTSCGSKLCSGLIKNLSGKVFYALTVIGFSHTRNGQAYWKCECSCGRIKAIGGNTLNYGTTQSCGCCKNINESKLEIILNNIFGTKYSIKRHYRPKFLKPQHLDFILIDKENKKYFLAIEYDGIQHYESVDFFGGIKKFNDNVKRDKRKNKIMKKNKHLIPYFIRIPYWEIISEENVIKILHKNEILIGEREL